MCLLGCLRPVRPAPVDPLRQCGASACPFWGERRRSEVTRQPPDQHPGKSGAPPIQARRHRRFTVSCHSARASEAVVVNEAGRVLLAGPRRQTLGNGGQEPTLHGGAIL